MTTNVHTEFGEPRGFYCETCGGDGALKIAGVVYLECECPTCHGESRGMTLEEYWEQLKRDAEFDAMFNAELLKELRDREGRRRKRKGRGDV